MLCDKCCEDVKKITTVNGIDYCEECITYDVTFTCYICDSKASFDVRKGDEIFWYCTECIEVDPVSYEIIAKASFAGVDRSGVSYTQNEQDVRAYFQRELDRMLNKGSIPFDKYSRLMSEIGHGFLSHDITVENGLRKERFTSPYHSLIDGRTYTITKEAVRLSGENDRDQVYDIKIVQEEILYG